MILGSCNYRNDGSGILDLFIVSSTFFLQSDSFEKNVAITIQVGKLKEELEESRRLIRSLRQEVEQKENIVALAVGDKQVRVPSLSFSCNFSIVQRNGLSRLNRRLK